MSSYLHLNSYPVREGVGKISKERADEKALREHSKSREIQGHNYESDIEKILKTIDKK